MPSFAIPTGALLLVLNSCNGAPGAPSSTAAASSSASAAALRSSTPAKPASHADVARTMVETMGRGDFEGAIASADPELAKVLSAAQLKTAWEGSAGDKGGYAGVADVKSRTLKGKETVYVRARLAQGTMVVLVGFTSSDRPSAVFMRPAEAQYEAPAYVDPSKLDEAATDVGSGDLALPGALVKPKGQGEGPFPIVVFVHGSGPGDIDEASGGSRPFRDLALGLASRGIASLRWEKRTHDPVSVAALGINPADITIDDEYFRDVAAAVTLASSTPGIDPKRVFVIGHSEGGWLTPWILQRNPVLAGGILLAGNARHFNDIVPSQLEYLAKLDDGAIGPLERLQIDQVKEQCELAKRKDLPLDTPAQKLPLGLSPKYWLSIVDYDAIATAKKVARPLLVLQGGRDYQVTATDDLPQWKAVIAGRSDSTTKLYPKLNHDFFAGEGPIKPTEYTTVTGHVDGEVIGDVAKWIGERGLSPTASPSPK